MSRIQTQLVSSELLHNGHIAPPEPLSAPDALSGHHGMPVFYVYRQGLDIALLRKSLQETIKYHHAFTGRMQRGADGQDMMVFNDMGMPFNVFKAKGALPDYGPHHPMHRDVWDYVKKRILPWHVIKKQAALSNLNVIEFEDGGVVLAFNMVHSIGDACSFWNFMVDWSRIARGLDVPAPVLGRKPMFDLLQSCAGLPYSRDLLRFLSPMGLVGQYARLGIQSLSIKPGTYRINPDVIEGWKKALPADTPNLDKLSVADLVTTHALKLMSPFHASEEDRCIGLVSDLRYRKALAVPHRMLGNALAQENVDFSVKELQSQPEAQLAFKFRTPGLMHSTEESKGYLGMLEKHRRARTLGRLMPRSVMMSSSGGFVQNNYNHLPIYDIDLGNGPPSWFNPMAAPFRMVKIVPQPSGNGGIDLHVTATAKELKAFEKLYGPSVI